MLVFHLIILTLATLWLMGKHNNWRVFNIRAHFSGFLNSRKSKSNSGGDFR